MNDDQLLYRASKLDCDVCPFKMRCCPKEPARKIPRSIHEEARDVARLRLRGPRGARFEFTLATDRPIRITAEPQAVRPFAIVGEHHRHEHIHTAQQTLISG